ncbi:MAG: hypothetical protein A2270_09080 [Elusimicrobia bacterium RIFOXYA12_FULL_51_18]|nr:MAG: hypothetical protein A2270_09080 [Elusimicrobia bacterium RIFOXYA12_FULL_51_18]OGS32238.1 MAG: hypothetical protein A2218_03965 [Elusimicrobia bacterium RIFOXYA2_FULL_53_38]
MICCFSAAGCGTAPKNRFLNPLIIEAQHIPLPVIKQKVFALMEKNLREGNATHISVYFQSLKTGYWFGFDEHEKFKPASLMKLYLMIHVLHEAEIKPEILKQRVRIVSHDPLMYPEILPSRTLTAGEVYSVEELLLHMIKYSDNNATDHLYSIFKGPGLRQVYEDFGLVVDESSDDDILTVKQFLMALLSLYNSTYLRRDMSEKALEYLAQSEFKAGIAAGVPHNIAIAHKFGERAIGTQDGVFVKQLHDCAIVYHPDHPYLLGVMTRGEDMNKLVAVIKGISRLVYKEVNSRDVGK